MASNGDKKTYPRLPAKNWWSLRDRFKKSMPATVDADYVQSVLGLSSAASAGNLIGPLRTLGLIDDDNRPTPRALEWRDDQTYRSVCDQMLEAVYPQALRDAFPDPTTDVAGVTNWFARNTGAGQGAAGGMASLFTLVAKSGAADGVAVASASPTPRKAAAAKKQARVLGPRERQEVDEPDHRPPRRSRRVEPDLNINIQIHISADASPGQIDQIFKSMAEHLQLGGVE